MKKYLSMLLVLAMLGALLAGCGSSSAKSEYSTGYDYPAAMDAVSEEVAWDSANGASSGSAAQALPQNRKWVITMDISAETEDLDATLEAVNDQIAALKGYIENQNISNGSAYSSYRSKRSASLTVRIPAENVDSFVKEISGCSNVTSSSRNVTDITLSYTDTESRITALRAEETRLLELMAQAEDMQDLLYIEERLTDVRYQLESYTSQIRRYDNQVDYATISLYISEVKEYTPVAEQTFWERITSGFVGSIGDLIEDLGDFVVFIVSASPYLVVLAIVIVIIVFFAKKIKKRSDARKAAAYQKRLQQYQQQQAQNQHPSQNPEQK